MSDPQTTANLGPTRTTTADPASPAVTMTTNDNLYFWRESDGETGYLSQWYYCPFRDDKEPNKVYKTAEHYMMHQKALLFNDTHIAAAILAAGHPRHVKKLGRKVAGFTSAAWDAAREDIVRQGNLLKFTRAVSEDGFRMGTSDIKELPPLRDSLRGLLVATGERKIVEASPYDAIWGIGFRAEHAEGLEDDWGLNLLGKVLMEVREILKKEEDVTEAA